MKIYCWFLVATLFAAPIASVAQDNMSTAPSAAGSAMSSAPTDVLPTQQSTDNGSGAGGGMPLDLPVTTDSRLLFPPASDQVIQEGDLVAIFVYGEPSLTPALRVNGNGDVDMPFLHKVHLAGLNTTQAQEFLAGKLEAAEIYTHPQIVVTITESTGTYAAFIGEMRSRIMVYGTRRLIDVIAAAGGLPSSASHTVIISRRGLATPIVVDLGQTPALSPGGQTIVLPGDVISIQKAGVVYVLGQFKSDGIYPLSGTEPTTLIELSAKLGDPNFAAKPHELRLIRTTNGQRHFVAVDYKAIVEGKAPDPILQAGDILYMPTNQFKAAITSGGLSAGVGLINLALLAYQVSTYH